MYGILPNVKVTKNKSCGIKHKTKLNGPLWDREGQGGAGMGWQWSTPRSGNSNVLFKADGISQMFAVLIY